MLEAVASCRLKNQQCVDLLRLTSYICKDVWLSRLLQHNTGLVCSSICCCCTLRCRLSLCKVFDLLVSCTLQDDGNVTIKVACAYV